MPDRYLIITVAMLGACALDRSGLLGVEETTAGAGGAATSSSGVNVPELDDRFDGDIDGLRVWSVPLNDQQICAAAGC